MHSKKIRVLLIEDDQAEAGLITQMLARQRQEYAVAHVRHLAEALTLLENLIFDCILIDLGLLDSQVLETALTVKNHAQLTPVTIITNLDDEDTALKALEMGIQDYLIKEEISGSILARSIRYAIQRRHIAAKLRESEERFASFMLHMPVAAWMKDMDGRYVYANAEAERVFATPLAALLGRSDRDIFPEETGRQFAENDRRVLSEGGSLQTTEVLRQMDGVEHHSIVNKFLVRASGGEPGFIAGIALDITERMRAEDALRESEEKFSKIFDAAPVGITISSLADGRFIEINREGERLSGFRRDEVIGRTSQEFDIWKDPVERARMVEELLKEGAVLDREMTFHTKKGKLLQGLFSAVVIDIGKRKHLLSLVSDISERKQAEKTIKESEERFRALVTASSQVIYRMSPDWSKMLQLYSQAFLDNVESPEGDWLRKYIHPDDQPQVIAVIQEAIRTKSVFELEHRVRRADGTLGWTFSRAVPVMDTNGEIVEWFGAASDITERKQAEEALRQSETRLRRFYDSGMIGICYWNMAGTVIDANDKFLQMIGYTREDLLSGNIDWVNMTPPEYRYLNERSIEELKATGVNKVPFEKFYRRKDGGLIPVIMAGAMLDEERFNGVAFVLDITDRKRAEEALEEVNKELQTFNYSVAHDLRQPLNTVSGYCQAIKMLCSDRLSEECAGYLQGAYDSTMRMNQLIEALLDFSRMAHVELNRELVDLSKVARELAEGLRAATPERRVTFRIADNVMVYGTPDLLRVVLDNLIGNAWKYTGLLEEAIIEFGSAEIDARTACFVRDNGPGFDMADAGNLFLPFQRLPGAKKTGGFGIGLATVERIIRRHGGMIWAEGAPDKGATFWFTLPAKEKG